MYLPLFFPSVLLVVSRIPAPCYRVLLTVLFPVYFPRFQTALCRSIDAIPDNQKYKQLQRELSQVLTQRQIYIQPDN